MSSYYDPNKGIFAKQSMFWDSCSLALMLVVQKNEYATDLTYARLASKVTICLKHCCQRNIPQSSIAAENADTATCPNAKHFKHA